MERNPKTTATTTTKMTKTSAGKKSPEKNPNGGRRQRKVPGTALYDWFIAIFGVAFVLSFSMNVMQLTVGNRSNDTNDIGGKGHSSKREAARSALRRAMKDFRGKPRNEAGAKRMAFEVGGGGNNEAGSLTKLAALDCKAYGGPSLEAAQEMVYWQDIHSDSNYVPPFFETNNRKGTKRRYLTFEPDGGGWNNIRMAMESTIALSVAMGRTLVMPPQKRMYLLGKGQGGQRHHFSFVDFFPIEEMAEDNKAFEVISMKEYLEEEAMEGNLVNRVRCVCSVVASDRVAVFWRVEPSCFVRFRPHRYDLCVLWKEKKLSLLFPFVRCLMLCRNFFEIYRATTSTITGNGQGRISPGEPHRLG